MKRFKRKPKKLLRAGAATVAAAGLLVRGLAEDPAALMQATAPIDGHAACAPEHDPALPIVLETDRWEPFTLRQRICLFLQRLPAWVRGFVLLPLWGVGEALTVLGAALFSSPVGQAAVHMGLAALALAGLFALIFKLLFPDVPLKTLFAKKNLLRLLGSALILTAANALLGVFWKDWNRWRIVLLALTGAAVLALLWARICQKLPAPQRKRRRVELTVN